MKVLVTCPPMLGMLEEFLPQFTQHGIDVHAPNVVQTLSEAELVELIPQFEGWIIGDDPATRNVFEAGKNGALKAAVKWGVGVDNVDFEAAREFDIPISNTPQAFGQEVADIAMSYVTALARETFYIDRQVRAGEWPKPRGISLSGKVMGLVGFGDIGRNTAKRAHAADIKIIAYDPFASDFADHPYVTPATWPRRTDELDFIVFTCALTEQNRHMFNADALCRVKNGVRVVNVARGPLIDEAALLTGLEKGIVHSAALDVLEIEPMPSDSRLRQFDKCIFGSHNASNTSDAVTRTSNKAINILLGYLGIDA